MERRSLVHQNPSAWLAKEKRTPQYNVLDYWTVKYEGGLRLGELVSCPRHMQDGVYSTECLIYISKNH